MNSKVMCVLNNENLNNYPKHLVVNSWLILQMGEAIAQIM